MIGCNYSVPYFLLWTGLLRFAEAPGWSRLSEAVARLLKTRFAGLLLRGRLLVRKCAL